MTERRKGRKKTEKEKDEATEKMTKLQKKVTSWLRKNVPTKKTKFMHSHVVNYFVGSKAVDALMNDSPWSKEKAKEGQELVFEYREKAVDYMDNLLRCKMFHRAKKIPVAEKEKKKKKGDKAETETEDEKAKDKTEEVVEKQKKKRKIRLDMHMEQLFLDVNDAYVWLYDPIPWYYWLGGTGIVLGIIALCLFPLWPTEARKGVYYLSVAAAGFLVFIIALAVIKYILFACIFIVTRGKLYFWIFPNLTEDVGFLESFWPIYVYTSLYEKKESESDEEESSDEESEDERKEDGKDGAARDGDKEGSDSEESRGSTGKDFEIIENKEEDKDKDI